MQDLDIVHHVDYSKEKLVCLQSLPHKTSVCMIGVSFDMSMYDHCTCFLGQHELLTCLMSREYEVQGLCHFRIALCFTFHFIR